MNLKTKSWVYGISASLIVLAINLIVLSFLGFPIMATDIIRKYFILFILLIGGFGLQIGLFTYIKSISVIGYSTTIASGGISGTSMILCCSHYIFSILPLFSGISGLSVLGSLSKYTFQFLIIGIVSNVVGIGLLSYKLNKYIRSIK